PDGVETELERGDHAEVAAAASQRPEQVGVLVLGRPQQLAVGRHDVDGEEIVDRKTVLAHQPADATAEGEPGASGGAHDSAGGGQTVHLRWLLARLVEFRGHRCRHGVLLLDGHIGQPRTATVKSRIWTSQPKAGAEYWRREDVRPILPHCAWRRDLRRALDTA